MEEDVLRNNSLEEAREEVNGILNQFIKENYSRKKRELSYYKKVTREEIEDELKYEYLDNFWLRIPMVRTADSPDESYWTFQYKRTGTWDKTYRQWLEEKGLSTDKYSNKLLNNTGKGVITDIETAVEDSVRSEEVSREKLQELSKAQNSRELDLYALPIFIRLYAIGYDHYKDLTE